MDGDTTSLLRERLALAAMGIVAAGCHPAEPAPLQSSAKSSASATTASADHAECANGDAAKERCFAPFANMRTVGTGNPAPSAPASAYDANGCLPIDHVSNGCCVPAAFGPRLKNGECCYDFCDGPCCGRAFVVDGAMRVAATGVRDDWGCGPGVAETSALDRLAAAGWLRDAQLEHASIASFGRFVLELLAVGAPAALVREAGEAMLDEVRHAERCFALAARFGGAPVGPRALSMEGALAARPLPAVAAAAVVEGCVGETIAALMAARQLERATDPEVRHVLAGIAHDEARHAELAFRFVRWALDSGDGETRHRVEAAFACALRVAPGAGPAGEPAVGLHALGRLSAAEQDAVARTAKETVLGPAVEILLDQRRLPN